MCIADCGLRIVDVLRIESTIDPQSAILNPQLVDRTRSGSARVAAVAARALWADRSLRRRVRERFGRRARLRREDRDELLEIVARARRTDRRPIAAREVFEVMAAAAALVFEKRHGLF